MVMNSDLLQPELVNHYSHLDNSNDLSMADCCIHTQPHVLHVAIPLKANVFFVVFLSWPGGAACVHHVIVAYASQCQRFYPPNRICVRTPESGATTRWHSCV